MSEAAFTALQGKRIVLLQGPVGPFFSRLRKDLERVSSTVFKVNFNGGDWLFYPHASIPFRGPIEEWPDFFADILQRLGIDAVLVFGDCRAYHRIAIALARVRGINVTVFEEGYLRPDYITVESGGVNGYSSLPKDPLHYKASPCGEAEQMQPVGNAFWHVAAWAALYYLACFFLRPWFKNYRHHRPLHLSEGACWIRSLWRKPLYKFQERKTRAVLLGENRKRFFLVPLQTHSDHQISVHSSFACVETFIVEVVSSFVRHAPRNVSLVIKHHPLDRGYRDYSECILRLREEFALGDRLAYVHDMHLPSLLRRAIGVVVVNSTAGMSALLHGTPVKACGQAIYDVQGLSFQGELDRFWKEATHERVDRDLYREFRHYVLRHTQVNGSFYKKLPGSAYFTGLCWTMRAPGVEEDSGLTPAASDRFANSQLR